MAYNDELDKNSIQELIKEYPADELEGYPVQKIRGKNGIGNVEEASKPYTYEELPTI